MTGSQTLLARIVDNLIDNAVLHNQPGGLINVTCETDPDTARLIIETAGPVLDQEAVARLAEPFRRLGPSAPAHRTGTVSGSAIVAAIAARTAARSSLYARERRTGSRSRHASRTDPQPMTAGMRVLVVEDAARLANWIAEGLRDQGIAVDIAYDGTEREQLNLNPYDVVVLDRDLPGIHGDTLCRMITGSEPPGDDPDAYRRRRPSERVTGLAWALTTTSPNHSTSPNWSYAYVH